jgi:outer membrane biosynthesis protein TonB
VVSRRYRQRWLIWPAFAAAVMLEGGAALAYYALRPVPPPDPWTLTVDIAGEGTGTLNINLVGDTKLVGKCAKLEKGDDAGVSCRFDIPVERWTGLTAIRGDKSTFEGWDGVEAHAEDVLAAELMMFQNRHVTVRFGKLADQIEVSMEAVTPPPDSKIALPQPPKPENPFEAEKLEEPPVELAMVKVPPPPPEMQIQPPPPPPPPPAQEEKAPTPPPQPPPDMRMVEVPDENEVKDAPEDATHLSDKNRDVAEETAATETNLEKQMDGKTPPTVRSEDTTSPDIGGPEDKIAQLEENTSEWNEVDRTSDHSGDKETASGQVVGEEGDEGDEGTGGDKQPGLMSMRDISGRGRLLDDKRGDGKKTGRKGTPGLHKQLDLDDYERIVGKDTAEKERLLARAKMTAKKGRWERKMDAIKSSLENFTPDVRPGNQTALKTRAHPFAVYVARMHRRIHELWGFGFLADLDGKSSSHELNDFELFTVIELAVNPDGTVYKTTIAKTSGKLTFDVAALDTVLSAAPYEETPEAIRSVDGRVYLRWGFYRNWRQCGTFNVEPYILTEIPGGAQPLDDGAAMVGAIKPKRGQTPVTPTPSTGETATPKPAPVSDNRQASYAANMWVAGFTSGSTARMIRVTTLPLKAGGQVAAATQKDLEGVYEGLLVESGPMKDWKLLSAADFTAKTGIPAQVEGGAMVLMLVTGKERFGVVLSPTRSGEYRATEILR